MDWQQLFLIDEVPNNRQAFGEKVIAICNDMNINPNWLMGLMYFETARTFSPSITNSIGCVGLIQFCASARADLNVTAGQLRAMSNVQQLDIVKRYFWEQSRKRDLVKQVNSITDLYLIIFYPRAAGKPDNYVLGSHDNTYTSVYNNNPSFQDGSGKIKVSNVKNFMINWFESYGHDTTAITTAAAGAGGLLLLAIAGYFIYKEVKKKKNEYR